MKTEHESVTLVSKMPSNRLKIRVTELYRDYGNRACVACKAPYVGSIPARASNLPKPAEARRPAGYFRRANSCLSRKKKQQMLK